MPVTLVNKTSNMETLFKKLDRLLEVTPTKIIRQWAQSINWEARMMAIRGPKGVGKSTMMLQYNKPFCMSL